MRTPCLLLICALALAAGPLRAMAPLPAAAADTDEAPHLAKKKKKRKKKKRKKSRRGRRKSKKRKKAEEEAARKAEEEAKRKAEEEARLAEQARKAEEEAKRKAEEEARLARPQLAVLPLVVDGLALNDTNRLNGQLRARAEATEKFNLQAQKTTDEAVASSQALGLDCQADNVRCAIDLGALSGAAFVLAGRAVLLPAAAPSTDATAGGKGANASTEGVKVLEARVGLQLQLVDVGAAEVKREVRGLVPADPTTQDGPLQKVLHQLFAEEAQLGSARLEVKPEGASIRVDGIPVGTAPLTRPVSGLLEGTHVVEVQREGYLPRRLEFLAAAGQEQTVLVFLDVDESMVKERGIAWWEVAVPSSIAVAGLLTSVVGSGVALGGGFFGLQATMGILSLGSLDRQSPDYATQAESTYNGLDPWREAYNGYGRVMVGVGAVVAALGVPVVATGATWGLYYLIRDDEADEEGAPSEAPATARLATHPRP